MRAAVTVFAVVVASAIAACSLGLSSDEFAGGAVDGGAADAGAADSGAGSQDGSPGSDATADAAAVIPDLLARFRFDEGEGTTAKNDVDGGPAGTLKNGATWVPGKIGASALHLDGVDDAVQIAASPKLEIGNSFTITMWVSIDKIPTTDDPRLFVETDRFDIKLTAGKPQLSIQPTYEYFLASYTMPIGEWHNLALTFASGAVSIWVDGVSSSAQENTLEAGATLPAPSPQGMTIGAYIDGASPYAGRIDDVRIYARVLTAAEIQSIAK